MVPMASYGWNTEKQIHYFIANTKEHTYMRALS